MNIDEIVKLATAHQSGSDTAREVLETEYTAESVAEFLAEADKFDASLDVSDEGMTIDQVREYENHMAVAAMTMLHADASKATGDTTTELDNWKHITPHLRPECDAGCLAVRANGVKIIVNNQRGDGTFPVYVREFGGGKFLPSEFVWSGLGVEDCDIEVLNYDCGDAEVLVKFRVKSAMFYRDGEGAVAICIEK